MNQRLTEEKSIYLQISQMIETDILRGVLLEEERVPSTNELAKLYTINPATAAKGINLLVEAGVLSKKRGSGLFGGARGEEKIRARPQEEIYPGRPQAALGARNSAGTPPQVGENRSPPHPPPGRQGGQTPGGGGEYQKKGEGRDCWGRPGRRRSSAPAARRNFTASASRSCWTRPRAWASPGRNCWKE